MAKQPRACRLCTTRCPSRITASTAWYRCSTTLNSLSTKESVKHHPEPPSPIRRNRVNRQRSQTVAHQPEPYNPKLARPEGFEPSAYGLEG